MKAAEKLGLELLRPLDKPPLLLGSHFGSDRYIVICKAD
jgi:hypothetical protein